MRIAMLLDSSFESDVRVEKEAIDLMRAGHQVKVICMTGEGLPSKDERLGIPIKRCFPAEIRAPFRSTFLSAVHASVNAVLIEEYDALHCHDYHMLALGARAKAKRPRPLIYDAHEYLAGWPFYRDSPRLANRVKGWLVWHYEMVAERRNVSSADRVVTISQGLSDAMTRRFRLPTAPVVIRNIPRAYPIGRDPAKLRLRFNIPSSRRVLLYSGALYHTDRQLLALYRIIAELESVTLLILGNRSRHEEARELARAMGYEGINVVFGDYIRDPAERQDLMSGADAALMHVRSSLEAHRFGFSNKFLEYTFAGLPIVAAHQEDCVAIGRKYGHATFYEEEDDAALRRGIVDALASNSRLRRDLSAARDAFSWDVEVKPLIEFYDRLA
ncbi:MAG: glycosyltransferase [Fimbriimonadaceae bacterium]|nr:glycosyltransferase [Fimbriimonadaceae bacterium]